MTRRTRFTSEVVSIGTERLGHINLTDRGFETFGPRGDYICSHVTLQAALKALFELHRGSERGMQQA